MLVGRDQEKKIIDRLLKSDKAEFLTVFGRRRVGKTFLIREHLSEKIVFDFTGAFEADTSIQLYNFYSQFQRLKPNQGDISPPKNWSEAFDLLTDFLLTFANESKKIVVFIDELPWLDRPRSGFITALEYFWNQHGSKMNHLLFITCGSAASWIIKNLVNAKGGLYNRVTQHIDLKPFTLAEVKLFCQENNLKFTEIQIIQLYMALGGIPFYWQAVEKGKSVEQVIDSLCFKTGGLLTAEFKPLYHSLFGNAENHIAVVEALAKHPYGLNRTQLLKSSNLQDGGTFNRTIENLTNSGFIKMLAPFGKKSKGAVYRIVDFFSTFYLKFIAGNVSDRTNVWQNLASKSNYAAWSGYAFENICLTHLPDIHRALGISGVFTNVSSWQFKGNDEVGGAQVDLVIDRNDGIIHLCEAKFTNSEFIITKEYNATLRKKRTIFQHITKTKKMVVTTLITTYPAFQNKYYNEEVHSEITADVFFDTK
ncbi:MAG: ATP-binding protein [Spirosomaceae bacterium]|nr:ATP-binding protein [Spirosomataceae bacterium]